MVFPSRNGKHLSKHEYRRTFDSAPKVVQQLAEAKRQQEIADYGEATTPDFPDITPRTVYATLVRPWPPRQGRISR